MNRNWGGGGGGGGHLIVHLSKHLHSRTIGACGFERPSCSYTTRELLSSDDEGLGCNTRVQCEFYFSTSPRGGEKKPLYYCWPDTQSALCLSSSSALGFSTFGPSVAPKTLAPARSQCVFRPMQRQVQRPNKAQTGLTAA